MVYDGYITFDTKTNTSGFQQGINQIAGIISGSADKAEIHSPSRLFRNLIGLNIMAGWADGIYAGIPLLQSSLDTAVDKFADASLRLAPIQSNDLVAATQNGIAVN